MAARKSKPSRKSAKPSEPTEASQPSNRSERKRSAKPRAGAGPKSASKRARAPNTKSPAACSPYELQVFESLRRVIRGVDLYSRKLAAEHGVTSPQLLCLITLIEDGPLTVSGLSNEVHLSASTVVGILDRLERKSLVVRERSRVDRRVVMVSATALGRQLVAGAPSPLQDGLAAGLARLSRVEQASIATALERIVELMHLEDVEAAPIIATEPLPPVDDEPPKQSRTKRASKR